jgi:riboflavin synthase
MFTGLVETLGKVVRIDRQGPSADLVIDLGDCHLGARIGDSIAINGCCLTIVRLEGALATFQAGEETLSRTNLGLLKEGSQVNLERALAVGDRLGGHYVTGHIDAQATLTARRDDGPWAFLHFEVPSSYQQHLASKGSVAVDGVSLTVVTVERQTFSVALIPHTLSATTLGALKVGDQVNLETDLLAKYVERMLEARNPLSDPSWQK